MALKTGDNNFGTAKFIVSAAYSDGCTHISIASALTDASSGDTIFVRTGTYTENLTLKAGVNLTAYDCDSPTPNVTILGKCTFTGTGFVCISGIRLKTNSDFFLAVTGSSASVVRLVNCYLDVNNNTGISYTSSNANSGVGIYYCSGDTATTGIAYWSMSGAGSFVINNSTLENHGGSSTNSTVSAGILYLNNSRLICTGITTSSTGVIQATNCTLDTGLNATAITHGGSATNCFLLNCSIFAGTASAISIGATLTIANCSVDSTNTNAITGAGTLLNGGISFTNSSSTINTTTQTQGTFKAGLFASTATGTTADMTYQANISGGQSWIWGLDNSDSDAYVLASSAALGTTNVMRVATTGEINFPLQSAFLAIQNAAQNNLSINANTTLTIDNEIFDQNSDYNNSTYTFTAPVTGRYQLNAMLRLTSIDTATVTYDLLIVTSNRNYGQELQSSVELTADGTSSMNISVLADMDASDTAVVQVGISNNGASQADVVTGSSFVYTSFSGYLAC